MTSDSSSTTRRALLKNVGAAGFVINAVGLASADGEVGTRPDCWTETDCNNNPCMTDFYEQIERRCCRFGDGTIDCDPWETTGYCCEP